jgi:hypothetical protein
LDWIQVTNLEHVSRKCYTISIVSNRSGERQSPTWPTNTNNVTQFLSINPTKSPTRWPHATLLIFHSKVARLRGQGSVRGMYLPPPLPSLYMNWRMSNCFLDANPTFCQPHRNKHSDTMCISSAWNTHFGRQLNECSGVATLGCLSVVDKSP